MQTFQVYSYPGPSEPGGVSNVTLTNSVTPGEAWFFGGEEYVYVYNAGGQQITQGNFAVLSANSGYSVTVSSVTGYDLPMGVAKHATITTGAYGWLLVRGFSKVNLVANQSATTADVLYPGGQGLFANLGLNTSSVTGLIFQPVGYVVSGAASGSQALAYVKCYGC